MPEMLLGALVFGLAISVFYLIVGYLAISIGLSVPSRNLVLEWIKIRKTLWGNLFQIGAVVIVLSILLYFLYFSTQYYGYKVVAASAMFLGWSASFVMAEIVLLRFGLSKVIARITAAFIAFLFIYLWFYYFNWIITDAVALVLALFFLVSFKRISFIQSLLVGVSVVIYDVIAVFGTGIMIKLVNVVMPVAPSIRIPSTGGALPILFVVPSSFALETHMLFIIGLGDIIVPGLIVIAAIKESERLNCYFLMLGAVSGYVAGVIFSTFILYLTGAAQPATIYLVPGVVLGFVSVALYCGKMREIFTPEPK